MGARSSPWPIAAGHAAEQTDRRYSNLSKGTLLSLAIVSICALGTIQVSVAKNSHHNNGHSALGAKLNQDGKHEVGKIKNNSVTAEVKGKKVVNMSAGTL